MARKKNTRTVEYYRLWDDRTWDTDFIAIPADTPEDKLEEAVRAAADTVDWRCDMPVAVGLSCSMDEEDGDSDPEDENGLTPERMRGE